MIIMFTLVSVSEPGLGLALLLFAFFFFHVYLIQVSIMQTLYANRAWLQLRGDF